MLVVVGWSVCHSVDHLGGGGVGLHGGRTIRQSVGRLVGQYLGLVIVVCVDILAKYLTIKMLGWA